MRCDSEGGATYSGDNPAAQNLAVANDFPQALWYAVQTRPRHEKKVTAELSGKGISHYLPIMRQIHRWSDRSKEVEVPLFPGYVFVHAALSSKTRLSVLTILGVLNFVGPRNLPTAIPEKQIESIQTLMAHRLQATPYPFLKTGQRVVIRSGALEGLEGIYLGKEGNNTLVISIDCIQQSLAFNIEGYEIQPL